jgi:hypothetical protein
VHDDRIKAIDNINTMYDCLPVAFTILFAYVSPSIAPNTTTTLIINAY